METFDHERRSASRLRLQIPVFIRGTDAYGQEFMELQKTFNISSIGALIVSSHPVPLEALIYVTVPVPSGPQWPGSEGNPTLRARVKRSGMLEGFHLLAVQFIRSLEDMELSVRQEMLAQ